MHGVKNAGAKYIVMNLEAVKIAVLAAIRIWSAVNQIIPDCDEVFNYWDPLNFLLRGFGKQTWEYSPEYSIRSWAYLLPYYVVLFPITKLIDSYNAFPPQYAFYLLRLFLAYTVFAGELHVYFRLKKRVNSGVANWFLLFSGISTGVSHASVELLPSSFALMCNLFSIANVTEYHFTRKLKLAYLAIFWFSIAGLLGWPFSLVLAVPLIFIVLSLFSFSVILYFLAGSAAIAVSLLAVIVTVDSTFYKKLAVVPFNIFLYNVVFADELSGPNIFGTEPFSYYIMNLLLNFNLIAVLAYSGAATPVLIYLKLQTEKLKKKTNSKHKSRLARISVLLVLLLTGPLFIWSAVFFSQPHKEERFLYPVYPYIAVSAALFVHTLSTFVGKNLRSLGYFAIFAIVTTVSILRTLVLVNDYSAPLRVYNHIETPGNVCVGREWYRYPSSLFLPKTSRVQFVQSGFNGLLPGNFREDVGKIESISSLPAGMNNRNLFDQSKVIPIEQCQYYVDIDQATDIESGEPSLVNRSGEVNSSWGIVHCEKFINTDESKGLGRILFIPSRFHKYLKTNLVYHNYCLLERKVAEKS